MSTSLSLLPTARLHRHAWWLLIAIHLPFVAFTVAQAGFGLALKPAADSGANSLALVLVAGAIQLRHSLAAAAGVRPRYWRWSLGALVAIVYGPLLHFGQQWITLQWFAFASFAMLLDRRAARLAMIVTFVPAGLWYVWTMNTNQGIAEGVWLLAYWSALSFLGAGGLYGAARLVRLLDEMREVRADLADLAVSRERLRISRDLHDLLGQSLSAVSLKGDLAAGLLERDHVPQAIAEIESLVSVARSALRDVLDIAHREPPIALASEIERVVDLLGSTGTETRVDVAVPTLPPAVDELFAWALREGVTNVLRHSSATKCSIRIEQRHGSARFEITNDAAMPMSRGGSGLTGLAARAAELSGVASGQPTGDGGFRLTVEVPEGAT